MHWFGVIRMAWLLKIRTLVHLSLPHPGWLERSTSGVCYTLNSIYYSSKTVVLSRGYISASRGHLATFWEMRTLGQPLASSGWRSTSLLDILQHAGHPNRQSIIKFTTPTVLKRNAMLSAPCRSKNPTSQPFHGCLVKDKPHQEHLILELL